MIFGRILSLRKFDLLPSIDSFARSRAIPTGTNASRPQSSYLDRDGALSSRPMTASPKQISQTIASFEPKRTSARRMTSFDFFFLYFSLLSE